MTHPLPHSLRGSYVHSSRHWKFEQVSFRHQAPIKKWVLHDVRQTWLLESADNAPEVVQYHGTLDEQEVLEAEEMENIRGQAHYAPRNTSMSSDLPFPSFQSR